MGVERFHHFDGTALSVMFVCRDAGEHIHTHTHLAPHTLYVIDGSFEVGLGDIVQTMAAHSVDTVPANVPHWLRSLEPNSKAICLLIPRAEDGRPLTSEAMDGMTAIDLWRAQERV